MPLTFELIRFLHLAVIMFYQRCLVNLFNEFSYRRPKFFPPDEPSKSRCVRHRIFPPRCIAAPRRPLPLERGLSVAAARPGFFDPRSGAARRSVGRPPHFGSRPAWFFRIGNIDRKPYPHRWPVGPRSKKEFFRR